MSVLPLSPGDDTLEFHKACEHFNCDFGLEEQEKIISSFCSSFLLFSLVEPMFLVLLQVMASTFFMNYVIYVSFPMYFNF